MSSLVPAPLQSQPPPSIAPLHWVKPPRQARSQRTLERLLDATEELIAERGMPAVTVSEVVRRAGSSVGAFYARFPDKDALLATLHERSCAEALATTELALEPKRWKKDDLSTVVHEIVRFTQALCRERLGLLKAFIALAAADQSYAARRATLERNMGDVLFRFLESREGEILHPDLRVAADVSIRMILGTLEYGALVHCGGGDEAGNGEERTGKELARAVIGYLGARGGTRAAGES